MSVVFFHQNEASDAAGGIERYLSTLLALAGDGALLVTEAHAPGKNALSDARFGVSLPLRGAVPKWVSYVLGVILAAGAIRRRIGRLGPCTLEFSRPEYVLFSWIFKGTKVFTLHGTGPARSERAKYWIHHAACLMLPLAADVVQIVGRDHSALRRSTHARLAKRLRYIDAWHDDVFRVTPFPDLDGPFRVFFAGRLAPMKNPELLFKIIEAANDRDDCRFEFRYFGADEDKIPGGWLKRQFSSFGLLTAPQLARAIGDCHVGILCSGYGEGSPFIVVEALACGRAFVLPPLPGLLDAYRSYRGVMFAATYSADAFIETLLAIRSAIRAGLAPEAIASDVSGRDQGTMARNMLRRLEADHA